MKSTRESYGEYLVSKGREDKDIVVFDADLAAATCTKLFKSEFPDRHFDIGIAEQDTALASGLAFFRARVPFLLACNHLLFDLYIVNAIFKDNIDEFIS